MKTTDKDKDFIARLVEEGYFIRKSTCIIIAIISLLIGFFAGYLMAPKGNDGSFKTPISESGASSLPQNKQVFDAIINYEKLIKENPNDVESLIHLGHLYFDTNNPQKAINAYEKALAIDPKRPETLVDCGTMYRALGDFDKAVEYMNKALEMDPNHEFALFNSGIVYHFDLKNDDEGMKRWGKLVNLNPNFKTPEGKLLKEILDNHKKDKP